MFGQCGDYGFNREAEIGQKKMDYSINRLDQNFLSGCTNDLRNRKNYEKHVDMEVGNEKALRTMK